MNTNCAFSFFIIKWILLPTGSHDLNSSWDQIYEIYESLDVVIGPDNSFPWHSDREPILCSQASFSIPELSLAALSIQTIRLHSAVLFEEGKTLFQEWGRIFCRTSQGPQQWDVAVVMRNPSQQRNSYHTAWTSKIHSKGARRVWFHKTTKGKCG